MCLDTWNLCHVVNSDLLGSLPYSVINNSGLDTFFYLFYILPDMIKRYVFVGIYLIRGLMFGLTVSE